MTSAVASTNLNNAGAATVPYGWRSPRVSFSRSDAAADDDEPAVSSSPGVLGAVAMSTRATTPEPAISKDFIDFEFTLGGSATMLSADELFADGKLLPLRKAACMPDPEAAAPAPAQAEATMPARADPIKPPSGAAAVIAADGTDPYAFSPRAPSCSSRWRELFRLKRAAAQSPSPKSSSPASAAATAKIPARAMNSAAARSLKLLLQRNNGRSSDLASAPLLRDSSDSEASLSLASSRFSLSSSSSSSGHDHDDIPRLSLDSADPNPPRIRMVHVHSSSQQHRHSTSSSTTRDGRRPSPQPPPRGPSSVDSPRMNLFGKIVFQSLERSSSSLPCSLKSRSTRAVDRSYSSGVRVAPVVLNVNVPVCGFFKDRKDSTTTSAANKDSSAAARSRSSLGRKTPPPPPHGWSAELPRSSG